MGPSIKEISKYKRKVDPSPLSAKCSHWLNRPLSVRTHHKFRKIWSFSHQKVRTCASKEPFPPLSKKCPYGTNPPSPCVRTSFMDSPYYKYGGVEILYNSSWTCGEPFETL